MNPKKPDYSIGICLGASTISGVRLNHQNGQAEIDKVILKSHEGNPQSTFQTVLEMIKHGDAPVVITGRKFRHFVTFSGISEPEAIEYALDHLQLNTDSENYSIVISAGGETFIVYRLDENNRIMDIQTGNKCASGTGEFFIQQIKRMGLTLDKALELQNKEGFFKVSGRCSVFCKSDCTHALNKGEPIENIINGLCSMIAEKIFELLAKFGQKNIMLIGGLSRNDGVIKYLKKNIDSLYIPESAPYFEALGAALAAAKIDTVQPEELFRKRKSSFTFVAPLNSFSHLVTFKKEQTGTAKDGDTCIIGLDVGSTTTKAVLMRIDDNRVLASNYLRTNGNPVEASRACYKSISGQLGNTHVTIIAIGVTGSGRKIAGLYSMTRGVINEIIAHAAGASYYDPNVDTIFEIGGQDAKYTFLTNSVASDYAMNEACSAGTGSFLEEAAFESLSVKVEDIADLALLGENPPNFNDQCAAFISSDIKTALHEGISRNDILAGLVYSIALNYVNRVKGHREIGSNIFMQGGVCYNRAVPLAMAAIVGKKITVPPDPGLTGAFGVALEIKKRIELGLMDKGTHDLEALINRQVIYESPFTCKGGKEKCDIGCRINRIRIEGKIHPFGGVCDRYYTHLTHKKANEEGLDIVARRNRLVYETFARKKTPPADAPVIGISTSFLSHRLFPLYYNFFVQLGCRVILPDGIDEEALHRTTTSICFPAQLAVALFENLLKKNPDYIFMPQVTELYVPNDLVQKAISHTCLLVRGEPFWLLQTFKDRDIRKKLIAPTVSFALGWEEGKDIFVSIGKKTGATQKKALKAYENAVSIQHDFEKECWKTGKEFLADLEKDPERIGIVLFGRPYNAYAPLANKGIPRKIASYGYPVIPYEMLPYDDEPLDPAFENSMSWESGKRILCVSQIVKRHKQLFAVFITNFLCGPDSFLLSYFRRVMGMKPCLTLELDNHTADAGINTRLEAFFDIVKNYRELQKSVHIQRKNEFKPAEIIINMGNRYYKDSAGKVLSLRDPSVKLILPNMGDIGTECLAVALRKSGINTQVLPVPVHRTLQLGRSVATGKECLPFLVCVGSTLQYLESHYNPDERLVVFLPESSGYCRLGQYNVFTKIILKEKKMRNVAVLTFSEDNGFVGFGVPFLLTAWKAVVLADVLTEIRSSLWALAINPGEAVEIFNTEFKKICDSLGEISDVSFYRQLQLSAQRLKEIPLKQPYQKTPKIIVSGEIYVRCEEFSNMNIVKRLTEKGFVVQVCPIAEVLRYANYKVKHKLKRVTRTLKDRFELLVLNNAQEYIEKKIKKRLGISGLCTTELVDIADIIRHTGHLFPKTLCGEYALTTGIVLRDALKHSCGIINIGPFGCMQLRMGECLATPQANIQGIKDSYDHAGKPLDLKDFNENEAFPFLTIEADGNPFPQLLEARFEHFCIQALRIAKKLGKEILQ